MEHIGGIEQVASGLAAVYRGDGHSVRWLAADIAAVPHRGHRDDIPLPSWNITEARFGFPWPIPGPRALRWIRDAVLWSDVVHLQDTLYLAEVVAYVVAKRAGRPVLITQYAGAVPYRRALLRWLQAAGHRLISRPLLAGADAVVFMSQPVLEYFARLVKYRREPVVVEVGIDLQTMTAAKAKDVARAELGLVGSKPLLLFVGRFVERKGVDLIRAVAEARPDWEWLLVGRRGDEDPRSWRLHNVTVLERVASDQLLSCYRAADLLVLPSTGEGGFPPLVVQEAMACGTRALVSDEIADGSPVEVAALLDRAAREPRALERAIAAALATPAKAPSDDLPDFARARWDRVNLARRQEDLLLTLVAGRDPSPEPSA